ncbi:IS66-like element accessory protein TnpA [Roseomonas chloroacetimidivorans]|uniref:IS66-like element accessory protein TnpA n=1 Tax=Roseomonas chloroacetimidivorans TaxID=1766656 RepID=UPI003C750A30
MEIISGVERRRRWRTEDKLRILAEIEGGASLTEVARRHDVSRGLLWQWREAQRRGRLVEAMPSFVPVRVVPELPAPGPECAAGSVPGTPLDPGGAPEGRIEIVLPDGTAVRVPEAVSPSALRRVLGALRG